MQSKSKPAEEPPLHDCEIMGENTPMQKGLNSDGTIGYMCIWCETAKQLRGEL